MLSQFVLIVYAISTSISLALGTGKPAPTNSSPSPSTPSPTLLLEPVTRTAAFTAAAWSKSAFACSLLALSARRRGVRTALLVFVAVVNVVAAGGSVAAWMRCRPVWAAWEGGGVCWPQGTANGVEIGFFGEFVCLCGLLVLK